MTNSPRLSPRRTALLAVLLAAIVAVPAFALTKKSVTTKTTAAKTSPREVRMSTKLTWPAAKKSRTYKFSVTVDPKKPVDYYASSVTLGGKYRLAPGFERSITCGKVKSKAGVEVFQATKTKVLFEVSVRNAGCSPVKGKTGAVAVPAQFVVRYDNFSRPTIPPSGKLSVDPK